MICVNQLMTREPFVLEPDATIKDATERILRQGLLGGLMVDEKFRPLGVVSIVDLARALLEPGGADRPIREVASCPCITVMPDEGIYEAIRVMVRNGVHRLGVVDPDGVLVGVVTPTDVMRGMVNLEGAFRAEPRSPAPEDRL